MPATIQSIVDLQNVSGCIGASQLGMSRTDRRTLGTRTMKRHLLSTYSPITAPLAEALPHCWIYKMTATTGRRLASRRS